MIQYFSRSLISCPWKILLFPQNSWLSLRSAGCPCTSFGPLAFRSPSSVFSLLCQGGRPEFMMLMSRIGRIGNEQRLMRFSVTARNPRWNFYRHRNLWIEQHLPEIEGSVGEDTRNWDWKSIVEPRNAVFFEYFSTAVDQPIELSLGLWFADVSSQSCPCEVQGIDEEQTETTCNTSGEEGHAQVFCLVYFWVNSLEEDLVEKIFGRKVDGLGGEISDNISPVAPPQWGNSFFPGTSGEAVNNT